MCLCSHYGDMSRINEEIIGPLKAYLLFALPYSHYNGNYHTTTLKPHVNVSDDASTLWSRALLPAVDFTYAVSKCLS